MKPSNILVTTIDGEASPKVIDFGVSKAMGASPTEMTLVTETGALIGTPQYMSPEQCAGRPDEIDTRSDVYSLGVVLYEALTGQLPYDLASTHSYEIPRVVREVPARWPSTCDRGVRGDLETILLRVLEKDRERRYASAEHLRADLERYLNNQPIEARRDSTWYVMRKIISRHRVAAIVAAVFLLLVTGSAVGLGVLYLRSEHHRELAESSKREAEAQRSRAERNHTEARFQAYVARISAADLAIMADDANTALKNLEQAPEELRDWEWHHLMGRVDQSMATLRGHTDAVGAVSWSPDGSRLASCSTDLTVRIWSVARGECLRVLTGHTDHVFDVAYSPDGRYVASGSRDHTVRLWDADTGALHQTLRHSERVTAVAFSPDGRLLAAAVPYHRNAVLWDLASGQQIRSLSGHVHRLSSVAFSPDGRLIATGSGVGAGGGKEATIRIHETDSGRLLRVIPADTWHVSRLAFSPDGLRLAASLGGSSPKIWDLESERPPLELSGVTTETTSIRFAPKGDRLVGGSTEKLVYVWDAVTGQRVYALRGHTEAVFDVDISPDGQTIASSGNDREIRIWRFSKPHGELTLRGHAHHIHSLAFSPDGTRIASGSRDKTLRIWDAHSGETLVVSDHKDTVRSLVFTPDGSEIISCVLDDKIRFSNADNGKHTHVLETPFRALSIALSPDGKHLAAGNRDGTVRLWNTATKQPEYTFDEFRDRSGDVSVAFSPDGTRLAAVLGKGSVHVWNTATRELIRTLAMRHVDEQCYPTNIAFSSDGRLIAATGKFGSGSASGEVAVWDHERGKLLPGFPRHFASPVNGAVFNPDVTRLLLYGDRVATLLDVATGKEVYVFRGIANVTSAAFSPDGSRIVAGVGDATVRCWSAPTLCGASERTTQTSTLSRSP